MIVKVRVPIAIPTCSRETTFPLLLLLEFSPPTTIVKTVASPNAMPSRYPAVAKDATVRQNEQMIPPTITKVLAMI